MSFPGSRGPGVIKEILKERYPGNWVSGSTFEVKFLQMLRRHGVALPTPQYEIRDGHVVVERVDFAYPHLMLIIECESWENHSDREPWYRDIRRYNKAAALGWRVIRAAPEDIADPTEILKEITSATRAARRSETQKLSSVAMRD